MRQPLTTLALCLALGLAAPAGATIVRLDGGRLTVVEDAAAPTRGMSMRHVLQRYGQPLRRRGPVGRPPITRWDYPAFSVYFEGRYVIHAVRHGAGQPASR